jgi:hypothetical protein
MGADTPGYANPFNPTACNAAAGPEFAKEPNNPNPVGTYAAKCRPLWDAKQAAKRLLRTLYDGYDRVAVVRYDFNANYVTETVSGQVMTLNIGQDATASTDSTGAYAMIDRLTLRDSADDAPSPNQYSWSRLNIDCTSADPTAAACSTPNQNRSSGASSCVGCGIRVAGNILRQFGRTEALWVIIFLSDGFANMTDVPDSVAGTGGDPILKTNIPQVRFPGDLTGNDNGFCQGKAQNSPWHRTLSGATPALWSRPLCVEGTDLDGDGQITDSAVGASPYETIQNTVVRYCGPFRDGPADCPPGATYVGPTGITTTVADITISRRDYPTPYTSVTDTVTTTVIPAGTRLFYNAYDYARDQIDFTALTKASSGERARGSNVAIYAIGMGSFTGFPLVTWVGNDAAGERLLRYMAAVGDDGDRNSDPCAGKLVGTTCGNYYYAPDPAALTPVFEDIARKIFTRLSQ